MTEPALFPVGIVGLSPVGRFLLERLSLLPGCEAVLFQPSEDPKDEQAQSLGMASITNWHRFLSESALKAVLFLDGESLSLQGVEEVFQAGLAVGILPPLNWQPDEWRELIKNPQRRWFLLNPHCESSDFRAARASIQSGELGTLAATKRVSWVGELVAPESPRPLIPDRWLSQWLWEDVDQLLQLAQEVPVSLYAADYQIEPAGYSLILHFPSGLIAHLERRRGSAVPLEIGWTITGTTGGYSNGHRHIKTEAGELYDVPVEIPALEPLSIFDPLKILDQTAGDERSARHIENVLKTLKAISQSAATRQIVKIEEGS
jgi:hypothetical protein